MIIDSRDLPKIREKFKDKTLVFCTGCFDITHAGHLLFFEKAKELGDILVVSLGNDWLIKQIKGDSRPVMDEEIRARMISSLSPVDYVFVEPIFEESKENTSFGLKPMMEQLKPDIYGIKADASGIEERKKLCDSLGIKLVVLEESPKKFQELTTTSIIERIKQL